MTRCLVLIMSVVVTVGCAAVPVTPWQIPVRVPTPAAAAWPVPVALAPLIDLRPEAAIRMHEPRRSRMYGMILFGALAWGVETRTGAHDSGDAGRRLVQLGAVREIGPGMDAYVAAVVSGITGPSLTRLPAVQAADVDAAVAQLPGGSGVVIVPILDQMDEMSLGWTKKGVGGGSYSQGRTTTTSYGSTAEGGSTSSFANVRLRAVVLQVKAGKIAERHVIYVATSGASLSAVVEQAGSRLADDLSRVLRSGGLAQSL